MVAIVMKGSGVPSKPMPTPPLRGKPDTLANSIPSSSPFGSSSSDIKHLSSSPRISVDQTRLSVDSRTSFSSPSPVSAVRHGFDCSASSKLESSPSVRGQQRKGLLDEALKRTDRVSQQQTQTASLQAALSRRLSTTSSLPSSESEAWRRAKAETDMKALYHPNVYRAHVVASTIREGISGLSQCQRLTSLEHVEQTAITVARLGLGAEAISAALLLDALDHPAVTDALLSGYMPEEVVQLIQHLAQAQRLGSLYHSHPALRKQEPTEQMRMILLALGDARVMLVILSKHLTAARQMDSMDRRSRNEFVVATTSLYVPLANRLGVWSIKSELEDLCFKAMKPEVYADLSQNVERILKDSNEKISTFISGVHDVLHKNGIDVDDIEGRPKSLASIRAKQAPTVAGVPSKSLECIHDVLAVRVIVPTKSDCYAAMRSICRHWEAVPGREKNYIRHPKCNGYRSLHNVVMVQGVPVEIQIRTPHMHWSAEFGLAAHWRYKEAGHQSWDMHVAWTRMVVQYAYGLRDYSKKSLSGLSAGSKVLREMTKNLMESAEKAVSHGVSNALDDSYTHTCATTQERYLQHMLKTMLPAPPSSIYVLVQAAQKVQVHVLPAVLGASTLADLQAIGGFPKFSPGHRVCINGRPVQHTQGRAHPVYMGDVVSVVQDNTVMQNLRNPLNIFSLSDDGDWPFVEMSNFYEVPRELVGVMLHAFRSGGSKS